MFSIVIPSLNEWYYLNITLDSIYNFVDCDLLKEIIIVDDFSDSDDYEFIKDHYLSKKIKLIKNKSRLGPSISRNLWAKNATWEVLIFLDAHMYCKKLSLKKLSKMNKYLELWALQWTVWNFSNKQAKWYIYKIKDMLLNSTWDNPGELTNDMVIETPWCAWWFTIIKKEIFEEIWWFNELFNSWGAEDIDLSLRLWMLWYSINYTNKLFVSHYFKDSFNYEVKTEKVFYNKYLIYKTYFEWVYEKSDEMLLEFKKHYWKEFSKNIIDSINNNSVIIKSISYLKKNFKKDINWYFKKFDNYHKF